MPAIHPQTLRRLTYFATIAELGSVRSAASQLRLSTSVVSQALADLEAELGVSLAMRTTRSFALTDAGQQVKRAADQMLAAAANAADLARRGAELSGALGITLPDELASHVLPPVLRRFTRTHPQVQLTLQAEDGVIDLVQSPYDIAIRALFQSMRPTDGQPCLPICVVVAPSVPWQRHGGRIAVAAPLLSMPARRVPWVGIDTARGAAVTLECAGVLDVSSRETARHLALQGLGVAPLLHTSVAADLEAGRLVALSERVDFGAVTLDLAYRDSLPAPQARVFAEMFWEHVAGHGGVRAGAEA